jgi:hypothetical protein
VELRLARRAGARIAVTGAAASSSAARSFLRAELEGVRFLAFGAAGAVPIDDALRDADMLVFVAGEREPIDELRTAQLAEAARSRGILVAAIVVSEDRALGRSPLLAALRDAAEMVMIVRDPEAVLAVVAALR